MKEIGFVAALVLILCGIVYWSRQSTGINQDSAANTTYESAVRTAKNVKSVADTDTRRRWVLSLQLTAAHDPDTAYAAQGDDADTLVVLSNDADSNSCSVFAKGEHGVAAATIGFTEVDCRNRSTGAVYKMPISIAQ